MDLADIMPDQALVRLTAAIAGAWFLGLVLVLYVLLRPRGDRRVQRGAGAVAQVRQPRPAAPAFDPRSQLPSRYRVGSRLARGHAHPNNLASNGVIVAAGGEDEKQTGAA